MFSGIVEEVGHILSIGDNPDGRRLKIGCKTIMADAKMGDSISVNGVCLTIVQFEDAWFLVDVTKQTLSCTSLGLLKQGSKVNLERALKVSDRLGGHIVSGHVDDMVEVVSVVADGFSKVITFKIDGKYAPYFIERGSVTLDGVSLTVAKLNALQKGQTNFSFSVALIPHTMEVTTFGALQPGQRVNMEADVVGKYIAQMVAPFIGETFQAGQQQGGLTMALLKQHGFAAVTEGDS